MITIEKILCPVDFFPASIRAADYAIALARNYESSLTFLHVVSPVPSAYEIPLAMDDIIASMTEAANREMEKFVDKARLAGVKAEVLVRAGDVDLEVRSFAEGQKASLVVMGTHGRQGIPKWFIGSHTERLLRRVNIPLLIIGHTTAKVVPPLIRRILVTTDFSAGTPDAIRYAFSMAQESQADVTLLHVVNDVSADIGLHYRDLLIKSVRQELETLVPVEARDWCEVRTRVETGPAVSRILEILESEKIDLLVMNIHGKGMLDRALLGSTAERVIRGSPSPVLLIPPMPVARRKRRVARKVA